MKKLLFLLCLPVFLGAQELIVQSPNEGMGERSDFLRLVTDPDGDGVFALGAEIHGRSYTGSTLDTTQAIPVFRGTSLHLYLSAKDSATVLVSYQLSDDGNSWTTKTASDSLVTLSDTYGLKSINFSTIALTARFIRFHLDFDTVVSAAGTTTPTYSASYAIRRD